MSPELAFFLETLLNGLILGGLYALITLGLALTFSVIDLVNFAHGDLFMMGAYTFFVLDEPEIGTAALRHHRTISYFIYCNLRYRNRTHRHSSYH